MITQPLARFAPVDLAELVDAAGLMTRIDRKYLVDDETSTRLLAALDPQTRALEIDGSRQSTYESVYFDTPDLLSYRMAAQARRRRFKLRTRGYVDSDIAYLEIKTKGARGETVKDRTEYDAQVRDRLTDQARLEVADALETVGVPAERATELESTLVTRYRRATLLMADRGSRTTIDTDLEWIEPDGGGFELPGMTIVETKSMSQASEVDRILWRLGARPVSLSKYATGLAALHPELPRNKWSRLLRGPFAVGSREETSCAAA